MPNFYDQLRNAQIENQASDPSNKPTGRFWLRTDTTPKQVAFYDGAATRYLATLDNAQTLTNKSIDAATNTLTNIDNAAVKSTAAIARTKIANGTASQVVVNDGSGTLTSEATLAKVRGGSAQDNSSLTFPASGTLATLAGTEAITNKDIDGGTASNTSRITVPKASLATVTALTRKQGTIVFASDVNKIYKDDGVSLSEVGSGSSGINYISNPDAESGTTGWATYADAAGTSPVDGTGGSPTTTLASSSDTTLRGTKNFLITKDVANRQGEGASYAFTIDAADKAKVLNVSFDYNVSAAFVSGDSSDVRVWIYDVTNSVLIPVSPSTIQGGTGNNFKFTGVFQTASNSVSYRLIIHVATTNASAWTMRLDTVTVGPQIQLYGAPIGDWTAFTPTFTGLGTVSGVSSFYRRVGDSLHVYGYAKSGTVSGSAVTISLPSGMAIDTSKLTATTAIQQVGIASAVATGAGPTGPNQWALYWAIGSTTTVAQSKGSGSDAFTASTGSSSYTSGDGITFNFIVPIAGWSSTVLMSNDTDTRVVEARYATSAGQTIGNSVTAIINFDTLSNDTHGAVTTGASWKFTAPVSGYYKVSLACVTDATTDTAVTSVDLYKNGSQYATMARAQKAGATSCPYQLFGGTDILLAAGDYIDARFANSSGNTRTLANNTTVNHLSISRISGPSAIAATETIAARYTGTGTTSASNSTATSAAFATKDYDTHGAFSSTLFTAPIPGKYRISVSMEFATNSTGQRLLRLLKNGSTVYNLVNAQSTAAGSTIVNGSETLSLAAGDTVAFQGSQNSGGSLNLGGDGNSTHFSIERVGN